MTRIHAGLPSKDFTMPSSVQQKTICTQTGYLATSSCPSFTEYFAEGTGPTQSCAGHVTSKPADSNKTKKTEDSDEKNYDNDSSSDNNTSSGTNSGSDSSNSNTTTTTPGSDSSGGTTSGGDSSGTDSSGTDSSGQ